MKKSMFMMGMVVAALASCTNEDVVSIPSSKAIGFDAFVGNTTKAVTPIDLPGLKGDDGGFYVFGGYETLPSVFNNTHITWNGSSWEYSPLSYWKEGESYKFAAYAPALNVTPTFDYESGTLTFKDVKSDMDNQKDFIAAQLLDAITAQASGNAPVQFTFRHAMAMIKISLKNGFRDGVKVQIANGFTVSGINTQGDFVTTTGSAGTWSNVDTKADFTDGGTTLEAYEATYEPEFIVIPQTLANAGDVTVKFSVILTDANGDAVPVTGGSGAGQNVKTLTIKIPAGTWNQQNRYSYSATIDGRLFGLQSITFDDPTVETWPVYTNTDVTIE